MWLLDPVTQALRQWAQREKEELRDDWEFGGFKSSDQFQSAVVDSYAQGSCRVLRAIETLDYQTIIEGVINVSDEKGKSVGN